MLKRANRDLLIADLQRQLDDMTLFLEEERLNHKDTRKKVEIKCWLSNTNDIYHHEANLSLSLSVFFEVAIL
jgi:hypothetical protein